MVPECVCVCVCVWTLTAMCTCMCVCASVFTCRRKVAYKAQFKLPVWEFTLPPRRAEVMMHGVINGRVFFFESKDGHQFRRVHVPAPFNTVFILFVEYFERSRIVGVQKHPSFTSVVYDHIYYKIFCSIKSERVL